MRLFILMLCLAACTPYQRRQAVGITGAAAVTAGGGIAGHLVAIDGRGTGCPPGGEPGALCPYTWDTKGWGIGVGVVSLALIPWIVWYWERGCVLGLNCKED